MNSCIAYFIAMWLIISHIWALQCRAQMYEIRIDPLAGMPGQSLSMRVRFYGPEQMLAGVITELQLPAGVVLKRFDQERLACRNFVPLGFQSWALMARDCAGFRCEVVRILITTDSFDGFRNGKIVFECEVALHAQLIPGTFPVQCLFAAGSDFVPDPVPVDCIDGELRILPPCYGDCDGNGEVTIDELVTSVRISLGETPMEDCAITDLDRSRRAEIHELILAVNSSLAGCDTAEGEP